MQVPTSLDLVPTGPVFEVLASLICQENMSHNANNSKKKKKSPSHVTSLHTSFLILSLWVFRSSGFGEELAEFHLLTARCLQVSVWISPPP